MKNNKLSKPKASFITRFFWYCAGANSEVLLHLSTIQTNYAIQGMFVLFTGILAFISGGFTFYKVFQDSDLINVFGKTISPEILALVFGLFWGFIIFSLDRLILSSIRKSKENIYQSVFSIFVRLVLILFLSLVITIPLKIRFFEKQIEYELIVENENKIERDKQSFRDNITNNFSKEKKIIDEEYDIGNLRERIKEKEKEVQRIRKDYNNEIQGQGNSGKGGIGDIAKELKRNLDTVSEDLSILLKKEKDYEAALKVKREKKDDDNEAIPHLERKTSFVDEIAALYRLADKDSFTNLIIITITLIFFLIESIPMLIKLILSEERYYKALAILEDRDMKLLENHINRKRVIAEKTGNFELAHALKETEKAQNDSFRKLEIEAFRREKEVDIQRIKIEYELFKDFQETNLKLEEEKKNYLIKTREVDKGMAEEKHQRELFKALKDADKEHELGKQKMKQKVEEELLEKKMQAIKVADAKQNKELEKDYTKMIYPLKKQALKKKVNGMKI